MNHSNRKAKEQGRGVPSLRRSPAEWLALHLDLPPDVWEGGMRLELCGRHALTVHGCRRILSYTPEEICLGLKGCILSVQGVRLVCASYLSGAVGIDGRVDTLSFHDTDPSGEVEA